MAVPIFDQLNLHQNESLMNDFRLWFQKSKAIDKDFVDQNSKHWSFIAEFNLFKESSVSYNMGFGSSFVGGWKGIIRNQEKKRLFQMHHSKTSNISSFVPDQPSTFLTQSLTLSTLNTPLTKTGAN
jgi:hypothetical protein